MTRQIGHLTTTELGLAEDEISYLEKPYVPRTIVSVMTQNMQKDSGEEHVWPTNTKYLDADRSR